MPSLMCLAAGGSRVTRHAVACAVIVFCGLHIQARAVGVFRLDGEAATGEARLAV